MRTALGDLQIGERLARETQLGHLRLDPLFRDTLPDVDAREPGMRLGIALGITARDHNLAVVPVLLELDRTHDLGLGLLTSRRDEGAGIDDHDVRPIGIRGHYAVLLQQVARHDLKVHGVLGATEGHEGEGGLFLRHWANIIAKVTSSRGGDRITFPIRADAGRARRARARR